MGACICHNGVPWHGRDCSHRPAHHSATKQLRPSCTEKDVRATLSRRLSLGQMGIPEKPTITVVRFVTVRDLAQWKPHRTYLWSIGLWSIGLWSIGLWSIGLWSIGRRRHLLRRVSRHRCGTCEFGY